ncbi:MAG: hypothetical protein K9N47_16915 [Prosthecobacter sp.]|uniref:hypothetical protein n=1 Tax=Prosthecobacter sp. TaxID=1965333 RepID=UPI0025E97906|nr:hypothetical protein [Prosthecobacter sp.]MCF7787814.1 hypothetical protein [Prosthecobacter sp.]
MKTIPVSFITPRNCMCLTVIKLISLLLITAGSYPALIAQTVGHVSVTATVKTEHNDPKGSIAEVVKKHLEIELRGSATLQGEVKVTCTFFADDLAGDKIVALKANDLKAGLEAGKSTRIISPDVTFNFTPQHSEKSGSGKRAKYKRVEATGSRYHGWAIRVFRGDEIVGEAYSIPSIKKLLE